MALKKSQRSLRTWTKQKWRTPSGKKSSDTGEVYAPEEQIKRYLNLIIILKELHRLYLLVMSLMKTLMVI